LCEIHILKTFEKKGAIAQSECLRQAPTKIKDIYYKHYICISVCLKKWKVIKSKPSVCVW